MACGLPSAARCLIAPGGLEVIRVIGGLRAVEIDDALDGVFVAIGLDQHRIRREIDSVGRQHHVIGHFARGLQVLVQQRRRHGERFAGVVEAGGIGRIHRKLARGLHVLAGEVADGVVVFGVAQAARQHQSRIAGVLAHLFRAHGLNPVDHLLARLRGRLRHRLGRHLLAPSVCRAPSAQRG